MNLKRLSIKSMRRVLPPVMVLVMTVSVIKYADKDVNTNEAIMALHATTEYAGEPFIPFVPSQSRPGKPANIPRRFLLEEADACLRAGAEVEVVAYVHSAISRVEERQQTRLTWASADTNRMVVVFMMGRAKDDNEKEIVRRESELYHDIVQGDYSDHYKLLSYKALSSLYWITRNCAFVPWTLHVDDDILIDTFILQQLMKKYNSSDTRDMFHCRLLSNKRVLRAGRWKVSQEVSFERYPPYCQGIIWMIPTKEVPRLLAVVPEVNYLWVDDVYVTGLLASKAGIKLSSFPYGLIGVRNLSHTDIGKKVVWYHLRSQNRTDLFPLIVDHYKASNSS